MKESCVDFVINFPNPPTEVSKFSNKKKKKRTPNTQHHGVLNTEAEQLKEKYK